MRKLSYAVAASLLVFGLAGQAHAVALGFQGTLSIQIATLPPVVILGSGVATVNGGNPSGHLTALTVPAGVFATVGKLVPITDPSAAPIAEVKVTAMNGAGAFAGVNFGGQMPINGTAKVCLYSFCGDPITASGAGNLSNLNVPLTVVGQGGAAFVKGSVNITVIGAPWTTGTAAIGTITKAGGASPASNTGAASGTVSLVTPIFISTTVGSFAIVPAFGILSLHFVPEPGTLMLLGSGIAGLLAFGRSRVR
jgi:hypothetical protein